MKILRVIATATTILFTTSAAFALVGGTDSPDTVGTNATISVKGASGTLIAPDLVVTNGHVAAVPLPAANPPFSITNAHDPAIWHPIPSSASVVVYVGASKERVSMSRINPLNSPRTQFELVDRNGGELLNGDIIGLKTRGYYLYTDGGRQGGDIRVDTLFNRWGPWQQMSIEKLPGSVSGEDNVIHNGDRVALKAADGSYLSANQLGGFVNADSFTRAARHEFFIRTFAGRGPLGNDPISNGDPVGFQATNLGVGWIQAPYGVAGIQIATPGYDDIALIKLAEPVPNSIAQPVPIKIRLEPNEGNSLDTFYRRANLKVVGYGLISGGAEAVRRQEAIVGNAVLDSRPSRFTAQGIGRSQTQPGDSGGSWFILTSRGLQLVGITQQTGNNFISPLSRGGVDRDGYSKPDLHAWFSMLLDNDDCVPTATERSSLRDTGQTVGANTTCRFGNMQQPFAVSYPDATRNPRGEDCLSFNAATLSLQRPNTPERSGSDAWKLVDGRHQMLQVEGTWQQSYTRGAYLIDYLQRTNMNKICFSNRPNPRVIYFRR